MGAVFLDALQYTLSGYCSQLKEIIEYTIHTHGVDHVRGFSLNFGLGMQRHAKASGVQHRQVIGPIAHGHHLLGAQTQRFAVGNQLSLLALGIDNIAHHAAGELAVFDFQHIGNGGGQAQPSL